MSEHATSRFSAALYDQQNEGSVADWGGDDLFTRMPRPRPVDDAPAPRFQPSLELVEPPLDRRREPAGPEWSGARDRRRSMTAEEAMRERADRLGLAVVDEDVPATFDDLAQLAEPAAPAPRVDATAGWDPAMWEAATIRQWDGDLPAEEERAPNGRRTKVITGRPDGAPRSLSLAPVERRRPARTPAEWVGPRPERIMAWAFVLGLVLILIAISTAGA